MSVSVLGVDTNVLVRFLADDDERQTPIAVQFISDEANQPIFLSMLVLSEAFTVLTRVKKFQASRVISAFRGLAASDGFEIENMQLLHEALGDAERAGCGLADALIARQNQLAGCRTSATFDIRAMRLEGMTSVEEFL